MQDQPVTLVRVTRVQETGQVADLVPEEFRDPDIARVSAITQRIISELEETLDVEEAAPGRLSLSEIQLEFGIDFAVEGDAEYKIPIIGPKIRGGIHGGATFAVSITISRK